VKLRFSIIYVALIVLVNWLFSVVPLVELPGGEMWPPMSLVVGLIFVVRDFAQREIGHKIILAMLIGGALSYIMADPFIAMASVAAFLISEFADWAVYSFTGRPFSQRILLSSVISTPIDSAVFLYMIGHISPTGVALMTMSKMLGAIIVWWMVRRRMDDVTA
jgi:queuosine precursor transporter